MIAPAELHALLTARGLTVVRVLRDTSNGRTLAVQDSDGLITVLKVRSGGDPQAAARHAIELVVYRALHTVIPTGWHVPTLLASDETTLTVQYLPGAPLGEDRYPGPISDHRIEQALGALTSMHQWQPPSNSVPTWPCTRVYGLHAGPNRAGVLTETDVALFRPLWLRVWARIEHGDPLPGNLLCADSSIAVIDFEHTGWQPAGTDWALMDLLWSPGNPWLRPHLAGLALAEGCAPGYALSLLLYAAHEIHLHDTVFPPADEQRRTVLASNLAYARGMATVAVGELS
ncbi:hypothetical protein HDA40_002081 [Hamadaea flava]|uniref:Phosphotransferase n=1 Tax=Hamadaea flava TaxID=1742688 RepID=A0ABV8LLH3_9ACTN|nr:phosphotransferase [Hamadaea flava]MCP2323574.1 hypothetical protein [Hamadaea flava]